MHPYGEDILCRISVEIAAVGVERDRIEGRILRIEGHVGRGVNVPHVIDDRSVCQRPIREFAVIGSRIGRGPGINVLSFKKGQVFLDEIRISVEVASVGEKGNHVALSPTGIQSHVSGDGNAVAFSADEVLVFVIPAGEYHVMIMVLRLVVVSVKQHISDSCSKGKHILI